jgi:ATP/maltotriose-dependent transcriptional regulator MalT
MTDDPPHSRSFEPLTRREREILTLLAQKLSDRKIAERLFIAQTTLPARAPSPTSLLHGTPIK